ncbi:winged helix-turn-helix domain-containing protein [Rhodococcus jostii]|uniref:winged helix-turn-helix domain-containing protein n=1 Tax=Rhodococcus jostii TaxID=132919 RepID=UPI0036352040
MDHPSTRLNEVVHQKTRLGILVVLSEADAVDFRFLQESLGATAGNLSRHVATLSDAGYVKVKKGYQSKRPRTWISLTRSGRSALLHEIKSLKEIVRTLEPDTGHDT